MKTAGQIGYEAYGAAAGWMTFDGRDMPPWESLADLPHRPETQRRWEAAAAAIQMMPREPAQDRPATAFDVDAAMERFVRSGPPHEAQTARAVMQAIAEQVAAERPPTQVLQAPQAINHDEVKRMLDLARQPQPIVPAKACETCGATGRAHWSQAGKSRAQIMQELGLQAPGGEPKDT